MIRGLRAERAREVADQLLKHGAPGAHARNELGITKTLKARPLEAAGASAARFAVGAAAPLILAALSPARQMVPVLVRASLSSLAGLGALGAGAGGACVARGAARSVIWDVPGKAVTAAVGANSGHAA